MELSPDGLQDFILRQEMADIPDPFRSDPVVARPNGEAPEQRRMLWVADDRAGAGVAVCDGVSWTCLRDGSIVD